MRPALSGSSCRHSYLHSEPVTDRFSESIGLGRPSTFTDIVCQPAVPSLNFADERANFGPCKNRSFGQRGTKVANNLVDRSCEALPIIDGEAFLLENGE